ncbi:aromatic amino acid ammonia-lyase [Prescottella defluvii]|nr:aromatic amino acid ammonia-lyase [Prescottella defluvii]
MAVLLAYDAVRAATVADIVAAVAVEALKGTIKAFDPRLQAMKKHPEQASVAKNVCRILDGSEIVERYRDYRVQDTYSLRGIPQIHGGAKRAIKNAWQIIEDELHSVGDNPVIFPEGDDGVALMGANFDSTFVGLQADFLASAMTVLAKVSERRTDRMVNSAFSELPAFLAPNPGLNNGYMIPQYTAAALYMEMKAASISASVDSVPTSANQEDPVSNAYLAVTKAYRMVGKLRYVLAIESMCATQAHDLLGTRADRRPRSHCAASCVRWYRPCRTTVSSATTSKRSRDRCSTAPSSGPSRRWSARSSSDDTTRVPTRRRSGGPHGWATRTSFQPSPVTRRVSSGRAWRAC